MFFTVLPNRKNPPSSVSDQAYLHTDNWNDWGKYNTQFDLIYVDARGKQHNVGSVKIGQFEMTKGQRRPEIPDTFDQLDDRFFSLGQEASYYEKLTRLGAAVRNHILLGLHDVAADNELFNRALSEEVMSESLLRSITPTTVTGQYRRLAGGGARLTPFKFRYTGPKPKTSDVDPVTLTFEVKPVSHPPTNIHVLIGRNAVGKTYLLNMMIRALLEKSSSTKKVGEFTSDSPSVPWASLFANLVSVTFSAFDPQEPFADRPGTEEEIQYAYVGLKRVGNSGPEAGRLKSQQMLRNEFVRSVRRCVVGEKAKRWRKALETLEGDPLFKDAEVASLADPYSDRDEAVTEDEGGSLDSAAGKLFDRMSTGHKIVLLTTTRLVETVEERTLVLMDEPESHLHPPLLSSFIRALSDLLIERNGVAIIATHSPVVLQEVPSSCVWKFRKSGDVVVVERPERETFGENVGVLTREAFGLEVTQSGFHNMLEEAVRKTKAYDEVLDRFDNQLGDEARAIVRAMLATAESEKSE
jgi:hypothetical protein